MPEHAASSIDRLSGLLIERVDVFAVRLPTKAAFAIAGGTVTSADSTTTRILVRVEAGDHAGWGEATPTPAWTYETAESIFTTIDRYLGPAIVGHPVWDLDGVARRFDTVINRGISIGAPLAKSAVDLALHDLVGRALGVSVGELWGQRRRDDIELGWIVSGDSPEAAIAAVAEGRDRGYRHFKVKVGMHRVADELAMVRAVRDQAPDGQLWIDGNQGFTLDGALSLARSLADVGVVAFEQPLPANDLAGLGRLRAASPVPIALDESLRHPSDLVAALRLDALDIAIAKVQRSGGLLLSRRLCQYAEDAGLGIMGSGLTDTELGFAASLHLFAAFGLDTAVDLNGRQFVESSYVAGDGVRVEQGVATVPDAPGLGVDVDETAVAELSFDLFA
ncbi:enolase C-terminal domain-like protein [Promicromonospora sp. NPDC023987]|uniref:mandelate racemase/muconate lactonizing enzyme family protein n=1 Tax=Promicromonospora sp. NPDC023987 TaxID=3155360 RepID=UPI00340008F4